MEQDNKNAYSEVIEILKFLDDEEKLEALPIEMLEVLKSKANPEYKPVISKELPLEEQNLQPETLQILAWIATKYWGEKIEENITETEIEPEKVEKANINELETEKIEESQKEDIVQEEAIENNNLPVLHDNLKWYQKIKEKIIEFFNKIFNKKKKEGTAL